MNSAMSKIVRKEIPFKRIFRGQNDEDANEFLFRFNITATVNQWSADQKYLNFEKGLRGAAIDWFNCQSYGIQWNEFLEAFRTTDTHRIAKLVSFLSCIQTEGESVLQYYWRKYYLGSKTELYADDLNEMILKGLRNKSYEEQCRSSYRSSQDDLNTVLLNELDAFPGTAESLDSIGVPKISNSNKFCLICHDSSCSCTSATTVKIFNRLCFACGQSGHKAYECRAKR